MSVVDTVAIAAAERVERGLGQRAGLAAWRKIAENATASPDLRAQGVVRAIRCAAGTGDIAAIHELARTWEQLGEAQAPPDISALCKQLAKAGLLVPATAVAWSETVRSPSVRSSYRYARCLDLAGDPRAADAFADVITRAEKVNDERRATLARVRRAAWLAKKPETIALAVEEAKRVDPRAVSPNDRLALARVLLRSPSRFARASAIGLLEQLAVTASPLQPKELQALAAAALGAAAAHADDLGEGLTTLESDRLAALFGRPEIAVQAPRAKDAVLALEKLARAKDDAAWAFALTAVAASSADLLVLHRRAHDVLSGRFEPDDATRERRWSPWSGILDVVVALRDRKDASAADALRALATFEEEKRGARLPAQAWNVALVALASDSPDVRGCAGRLAHAMLRGVPRTPPRGWLAVAHALSAAGMDDVAAQARRLAALAKEAGAEEALALALTRAGWQLAHAGERSRAIAQLREAKALWEALAAQATQTTGATPST
jgi:hypothetical protein